MAQFGPHAQARLRRSGRGGESKRGSTLKFLSIAYCLLRSLVKHSCINPKFLTFDYLDEKPVDTGLMKFLGFSLPPCLGTWSLPLHSPPPRPLLRPTLSLHESKGSMTPWKSRLCGTIALPAHDPTICCLTSGPFLRNR
ncbi:hypothetical protein BHE74_00037173 [Ensete ventricosum]|nr:hypothetical protein GW17_00029810 [Ensete ventricosum]RWW56132.1 hypothetical protein BHE74_00037173 [Ensete ventricosum]